MRWVGFVSLLEVLGAEHSQVKASTDVSLIWGNPHRLWE